MYEKGYIYKGKKPSIGVSRNETALAEAEIEYADTNASPYMLSSKLWMTRENLPAMQI
jgi:isoleucyl-tRNA synthetase